MMKEIGFDTDVLNNEIVQLRSDIDEARQLVEKTYIAMEELNATWEGEANRAYRTAFLQDQEDLKEICDIIEGIVESMQESNNDYQQTDEEVTNLIQTLN